MNDLLQQFASYASQPVEQQLLMTLILGVLALTGVTALLAVVVLILRLLNLRHDRRWVTLHEQWNGAVLDVLSGDLSPAVLRDRVSESDQLDFIRFLLPYAHRVRGSDRATLSQLARPFLDQVLRLTRHHEDSVRLWAVNVLNLFGMPEYELVMGQLLRDPSPLVSLGAANALLGLGQVHYIRPVMEQFPRYEKWNHNALSEAITRMGEPAIAPLEMIYIDPSWDPRTRVVAADVLRRLNHYPGATAAERVLNRESDPQLLIASLRLLGDVGRERHCEVVRQLCTHPVEGVRVNAVRALRHLGGAADLPFFRNTLDDPSPWVARQGAKALVELGDSATLRELAASDHPRAALARQIITEAATLT